MLFALKTQCSVSILKKIFKYSRNIGGNIELFTEAVEQMNFILAYFEKHYQPMEAGCTVNSELHVPYISDSTPCPSIISTVPPKDQFDCFQTFIIQMYTTLTECIPGIDSLRLVVLELQPVMFHTVVLVLL